MAAAELDPWISAAGDDGNRNSMQEFETDGVQTSWDFNFAGGYIDASNVKAYLYDTESGIKTDIVVVLTGPNTIQVTPAPAAGNFLVVYRDTQKTVPLVDFTNGAVLNESNLDTLAKQAVFNAAEMVDRFDEINASSADAIERSFTALTTANDAKATADAASTAASGAVTTANAANASAIQANTNAAQAVSTANGIDGKAQSALDNSAQAVSTANAASTTANGIDGKATQAMTDSADAKTSAAAAAESASHAMQRYAASAIPSADTGGVIAATGQGVMEWSGTAYVPLNRFSQCRLDGGTAANSVKLSRYKGNKLTVGNVTLTIPAAGIEIVPAGITNGVIYYTYAYNNAGTLGLEYSTTSHVTQPDGAETKAGDPSRLLVGFFRSNGSSQIVDTRSERGVASWFNQQWKPFSTSFNTTTTSTALTVVASVNAVSWNQPVSVSLNCRAALTVPGSVNASGSMSVLGAAVDAPTLVATIPASGTWVYLGAINYEGGVAEGFSSYQFSVAVSNALATQFFGFIQGKVLV